MLLNWIAQPRERRCVLCRLLMLMLLLVAAMMMPLVVAAQFLVQPRTTADGLPQNTLNAIVQTTGGYLWIATFGGLARVNGVRVTALHEDQAGVLWIATETGEISCLRAGEFHSFANGKEEEIYI